MQFTIFGENSREGSYILLIDLNAPAEVSFGRFLGGRAILLEPGKYLYVGSALGAGKGTFPLAGRLLRHASRSGDGNPHAIRSELIDCFASMGYRAPDKKGEKKLHWHIDYLLDLPEAEIAHVAMFMGPSRIEHRLAQLVASMPESSPVADRLGAQDERSGTHLFRVSDPDAVLANLEWNLSRLMEGDAFPEIA
jgi:Uri superfamily endonuclease